MVDLSDIQEFLGNQPGAPGIRQLNRLIQVYIRKVPWESVFRIAKRAATPDPSHCPRLPDEFWQDAIHFGGGGTCFESNYAFFWLLQKLGYRGYLTVNDMGEQRGCHAAIVIELNQGKFLVDVGIPLLVALPIHPERATHRSTWLHTYTIQPDGANRYQILRSRHPKPNIYTLLDRPVPDAEFRQVIERDYGESGLFLNRVIIVKVIGERLWRFSSDVHPYLIESFGRDDRQEEKIPARQAPHLLARRFQMNQHKIETAFKVLSLNP
jgi:arylamine N-acetyltransferase